MPRYKVPDSPVGGQKVEPEQPLREYEKPKMPISKRLVIGLIVLIAVLVVVGIWVGSIIGGSKGEGPSGYTAVFLTSGDIYFGKLSWFPWPKLTSAWFIQRGVDEQNRPQLAIAPFNSVFWGPVGDIYLNPKEVLFWAPVKASSQVAKAIDNPSSVQAPPQQQQPTVQQAPEVQQESGGQQR